MDLRELIDPGHAMLVVVDMQNDFCHPEGAHAKRGKDVSGATAIVPALERLLAVARAAGTPVLFTQHNADGSEAGSAWNIRRQRSAKSGTGDEPDVCQPGSWGADFYGVAPAAGDHVVVKHRYSMFARTDVAGLVDDLGVSTLVFTGVTTNVCVESSIREALALDYYPVMVEDCCATYARAVHEASVHNVERHFGFVVSSADAIVAWTPQDSR